jgi:hypothetical protein
VSDRSQRIGELLWVIDHGVIHQDRCASFPKAASPTQHPAIDQHLSDDILDHWKKNVVADF